MKTLKDIERNVLRTLGSVGSENGQLTVSLLMRGVERYREKYGYVPDVWLRLVDACTRFKQVLVNEGYSKEDLGDMTVLELRDAVSSTEYLEVREATVSGGVKVKRIRFRKVA